MVGKLLATLNEPIKEVLILETKANMIKAYRVSCNYTQQEMATALGVHVNTYRALEENPDKMELGQLKKFVNEIQKVDNTISINNIIF